jgi:protein TonB
MVVVAALHAIAIGALLSYAPVRQALFEKTVNVSLITPPKPEPPKPEPRIEKPAPPPVQPKPKPMAKVPEKPAPPQPILAAPVEAPTAAVTPPAPPVAPPGPVTAGPPGDGVGITPPNFSAAYLENPPPPYPAFARRAGEQGRVILRVYVSAAGTPETVQVRTSSGSTRLDEAALETVKRWKFVPARRGDEPVAAWVLVPINFKLEG